MCNIIYIYKIKTVLVFLKKYYFLSINKNIPIHFIFS